MEIYQKYQIPSAAASNIRAKMFVFQKIRVDNPQAVRAKTVYTTKSKEVQFDQIRIPTGSLNAELLPCLCEEIV